MASPATTFGPFVPYRLLGTGGMAEVWAAHHEPTGTRVAIKRLQEHLASSQHALFLREVEAMAGLHHPNILTVWDYGLGEDGRAWVALERAEWSLQERPPTTWKETRAAWIALLDGLAHAHAHRIVHRDVKPANLLMVDALAPHRLADFGLVHVMGAARASRAGTPAYMAPEQFDGRHRDFGPWTDLYAAGCVLWEWVSGAPPYDGTVEELSAAHHAGYLPPLRPRFRVPDGLEELLHELLSPDPADRPASAAAALLELASCGTDRGNDTAASGLWLLGETVTVSVDAEARSLPATRPPSGSRLPVPGTWRSSPSTLSPLLTSVGLGLFAFRGIPMVGRFPQRDLLWAALHRVVGSARTELVVVDGESGAGASALGRWLCERVSELDVATPLRIEGSLSTFLLDHLGGRGLGPDALERRLRELGLADPASVARAALGGAGAVGVVRRRIAELAGDGAVVVWVDDPDQDADALALVLDLVRAELPRPVLVVATGRVNGLRHATGSGLASEVTLGPLTNGEAIGLLCSVLGLGHQDALALIELHGEWPGRLLSVVRAAVGEGHCRTSSSGFHLELHGEVVPLELPWLVLALLADDTTRERVWERLAPQLAAGDAIERAARAGLVRHVGDRTEVLPALRVRAASAPADDRAHAHRLILSVLPEDAHPMERARHLAEAGEFREALELLRQDPRIGITVENRAAFVAAARCVEGLALPPGHPDALMLDSVLLQRRLNWRDVRDVRANVERSLRAVEDTGGRCPASFALVAATLGDPELARRALRVSGVPRTGLEHAVRGRLHQVLNEVDDALVCYEEALRQAREGGSPTDLARALNDLAVIYQRSDRSREAVDVLTETLRVCREHGVGEPMVVEFNLIGATLHTRDDDAADRFLDLARRAEEAGDTRMVTGALYGLLYTATRRGPVELVDRHAAATERGIRLVGLRDPRLGDDLEQAALQSPVLDDARRAMVIRVARTLQGT